MNKGWRHIAVFLLWAAASLASAQTVTFVSEVDSRRTAMGSPINLTVRLEVSGQSRVANMRSVLPPISEIPGFQILERSGPSYFENSSSVNFRTSFSSSLTYQYVLQPARTGLLTIPAFEITYSGQNYQTKPIQVEVQDSGSSPAVSPGGGEPIIYPESNNRDLNRILRTGAVFIRPVINKKSIYAGEIFRVSYEMYLDSTALQWQRMRDLTFSGTGSAFEGFIKRSENGPGFGKWMSAELNGKSYMKAPVYEVELQPQRGGKQTIAAWSLWGNYGNRMSFFTRPIRFLIPTKPIDVEVKALPEQGKPDSFTGAVGQFDIKASLDNVDVSQNDVVTLRIEVAGPGNLSTAKEPKLPTLAQFEQYGDINSQLIKDDSQGLAAAGSKVFEVILRPLESGSLTIPPIRYAYFDPATEAYKETATDPLSLNVAKVPGGGEQLLVIGALPSTGTAVAANRRQTLRINEDIQFIRVNGFRGERRGTLVLQAGFWAFQVFALLLIMGSYTMRRQRERLQGDVGLARRRQARGMAGKRLKTARQLLRKNLALDFYAELDRTIRGFLSDHLNVADRGVTIEQIVSALENREVGRSLIDRTRELLEVCDQARYAPGADASDRMEDIYEKCADVLNDLASSLR